MIEVTIPSRLDGALQPAPFRSPGTRETDPAWAASKEVLFLRDAGPVRIVIIDGGHEADVPAAFTWLASRVKTE